MTINEAIAWLERLREKHGGGIQVCFDCPECEKSFTPNTVATEALHIKAKHAAIDEVEP